VSPEEIDGRMMGLPVDFPTKAVAQQQASFRLYHSTEIELDIHCKATKGNIKTDRISSF